LIQPPLLQTKEQEQHQWRLEQLLGALSHVGDAITHMKLYAVSEPDKFYKATLNALVEDLERIQRRSNTALRRITRETNHG
jgi:hypothetical protein